MQRCWNVLRTWFWCSAAVSCGLTMLKPLHARQLRTAQLAPDLFRSFKRLWLSQGHLQEQKSVPLTACKSGMLTAHAGAGGPRGCSDS